MFEYTSSRASVEVSVAGFFVTLFFVFSSSFVMNAGLRAAAEIITKRDVALTQTRPKTRRVRMSARFPTSQRLNELSEDTLGDARGSV